MTRVLLCAAVLFLGCGTTPEDHRALGDAQFEDIPVPRGATYRNSNEQSYSYRSENFRCGRFRYRYDGSVQDATTFFRTTMVRAPYNWALNEDDRVPKGSTRLVFTKDDERCTIDVDYVPGTREAHIPKVFILVRLNYTYH